MSTDRKDRKLVIVVRRKPAHHPHHGGSWKVAYADFVTAMMAFFLVMWIMGMESDVKDMVQGYFNNPVGFSKGFSGGENVLSVGASPVNSELRRLAVLAREHQRQRFEETRQHILDRLGASEELRTLRAQIEIVVTQEGLRIELVETATGETFFGSGSATVQPLAGRALAIIGAELGRLPNPVLIEGHTDAAQFGGAGYTNWELSVDRALAARRLMVNAGLHPDRLREIRGHADRQPRTANRYDAANRRVTILLPFELQGALALPAGALLSE